MDKTLKFLADYAASLSYEKLGPDVIHQVKRRVMQFNGLRDGMLYFGHPRVSARACHGSDSQVRSDRPRHEASNRYRTGGFR